MAFDIEGARKAGYSDDEIAGFLGEQSGFDTAGAIKSGYSAGEVVGFLSQQGRPASPRREPAAGVTPSTDGDVMAASSDPFALRVTPSTGRTNPTLTVSDNTPKPEGPSIGAKAEMENLRDSFFTGVDNTRAAIKSDNMAIMATRLQATTKRLQDLEARGEGDSITARQMRNEIQSVQERLPATISEMTEAQGDAQRGAAMTTRPVVRKINEAKTFADMWSAFKEDPVGAVASVTSTSMATTIPALIAGALAGPVAGAALLGANSAVVEAGSSLADYARDNGVDVTDPVAVQAFFTNRDNLAAAMGYAGKRAGIIGSLDALSGGVAGKTIAPAFKSKIARQAVNMPAQMAVQAGLGAGGEAGGQLATKGEIDQPGQVFLEAVGELGGAPSEVMAFSNEARHAMAPTRVTPRVEDMPATPQAPAATPTAKPEMVSGLASKKNAVPAPAAAPSVDLAQQAQASILDMERQAAAQPKALDVSNPVGNVAEPAGSAGSGSAIDAGGELAGGRLDSSPGGNLDAAGAPARSGGEAVAVGNAGATTGPVAVLNDSGTLTVRGDPDSIISTLRAGGVTSMLPARNGVLVSSAQAEQALKLLQGHVQDHPESAVTSEAAAPAVETPAPARSEPIGASSPAAEPAPPAGLEAAGVTSAPSAPQAVTVTTPQTSTAVDAPRAPIQDTPAAPVSEGSAVTPEAGSQPVSKPAPDVRPRLTGADLVGKSYDELDAMHAQAVAHNRAVDLEAIRRFWGPEQAKEADGWTTRKRESWLTKNETDEASNWTQDRYINDELIREHRDAANDFDTEGPVELGRSIAVRSRNVDKPGFFETPEGAAFSNALRYAKQQGWDLNKVMEGMRGRSAEWAGDDAPELFARLFKKVTGEAAQMGQTAASESKPLPAPEQPATKPAQEAPAALASAIEKLTAAVTEMKGAATASAPEKAQVELDKRNAGKPADANPDQGAMFARAAGFDQAVEDSITDAMRGKKSGPAHIDIGTPSPELRSAGIPDVPLRTTAAILTKALFDHGVTKSALKALPELLDSPVMVFESDTVPGRFVVVTSRFIGGKPLVVAISPEKTTGAAGISFVPSLYPKDRVQAIRGWVEKGLLRYEDKKQSPQWLGSAGLQLPSEYRPTKGSQESSIEQGGPGFKRGNFARPATLSVTQIQRAVDKLTLNWLKKPDIHILESMEEAPGPVRAVWEQQNSQGAVGAIEGFHWRGGVYIVADRMESGSDIIRVLYHEALGHFGLRNVFGRELDTVLRQVAMAKPREMKAKAAQYGFDLSDERQRMSAAEEILAEMAQERPENTIVQRAIAIIRKFLRENVPGFVDMKMTDAEIVQQFLTPARDFVENGKRREPSFAARSEASMASRAGDEKMDGALQSRAPVPADASGASDFVGQPPKAGEAAPMDRPQSAESILPEDGRDAGHTGEGSDTAMEAMLKKRAEKPAFSRKAQGDEQPGIWVTPEPTSTDALIYELQDGRIDLKRVQEAIEKAGKAIEEKFDARLAETLYPGRVAKRADDFLKIEVKPLLQNMARNDVGMDELGDYLLARHAPERNAQIAIVNPGLPDGGAGSNSKGELMTTAAAKKYIADLSPARRDLLTALAKQVDGVTQGTRAILLNEGLETAETIEAWTGAYEHYVPLFKDEAADGAAHPIGSGFNVKGSSSKRAIGSTKEVTNVLAHVLMQREAAITRAEKNRVGLALYGLALSNPNAEFWATVKPSMSDAQIAEELQAMGVDPLVAGEGMQLAPQITTVDPKTNRVVSRPNPVYKSLDNALVLKVAGEDRVVLFNAHSERAMRLAGNLKNLDSVGGVDWSTGVISRVLGLLAEKVGASKETVTSVEEKTKGINAAKATRFIAAMATQYNPAFGAVNVTRDIQGAMVNLSSTELAGKQAKVFANVPAAMKGIARELRGGERTSWSDLFVEFQKEGGQTGYRDQWRTPDERAQAIAKELKAGGGISAGKAVDAVLELLSGFNDTLENSVRLSAYKVAIDQGVSKPKAARLAREITVDFNRRGVTVRNVGPVYAFLNASMQGTARTIAALKGPAGAKIVAGGLAIGVLQALALWAAGLDDDEIPDWVKARALIIPMPGKSYIAIPMPLGLNVIPNTGRLMAELALYDTPERGKKVFNAIGEAAGAVNPLGGGNIFTADGALKTVAPTLADPFIELSTNRNFAGGSISKHTFEGDARPGFQRPKESTAKTTTGQAYIAISKAINTVTGGGDFEKGAASPTPEEVRYIVQLAGGGVLREFEKAINSLTSTAQGEPIKASQVPLGSRFYGEVSPEDVERSRYYANKERLEKLEARVKGEGKRGNSAELEQIYRENPAAALVTMNNKITTQLGKLNRMAMESIADKKALAEIDTQRTELMHVLNATVKEMEAAAKTDKAKAVEAGMQKGSFGSSLN